VSDKRKFKLGAVAAAVAQALMTQPPQSSERLAISESGVATGGRTSQASKYLSIISYIEVL